MNRTIKLRMWSTESKQFFDKSNVYECLKQQMTGIWNHEDMIWQQFTGFVDAKGNEIYEGDLLQFTYREDGVVFTGEVKYSENFACYIVVVGNAFETFSDLAEHAHSLCVVGNIFENKDLLK